MQFCFECFLYLGLCLRECVRVCVVKVHCLFKCKYSLLLVRYIIALLAMIYATDKYFSEYNYNRSTRVFLAMWHFGNKPRGIKCYLKKKVSFRKNSL